MPDLSSQKVVAARVLGCGKSRVWLDPSRIEDIKDAITAEDIRKLAKDGVIRVLPKKGVSNSRKNVIRQQKAKGRRKGKGSMKGKIGTRTERKRTWIKRIRTIRSMLRELRGSGSIDKRTYHKVYMMSKSGYLRNRAHLMAYLERSKMLKGGAEKTVRKQKP